MKNQMIDAAMLLERLPFRPPYLMIDRAEVDADAGVVTAVKAASAGEPYFAGHFPGQAIMPGVLQVEMMFQAACLLVDDLGPNPAITAASKVKFRKPVTPGDMVRVTVEKTAADGGGVSIKARAQVGEGVTSQANLTVTPGLSADQLAPHTLLPRPKFDGGEDPMLDLEGIEEHIPHRFPFLLIDRVLELATEDGTGTIRGTTNVAVNDSHFLARGSDSALFLPPSLQMKIVAQLGCVYMLSLPQNKGKLGMYMGVDQAAFHQPILPGDHVCIEVQETLSRANFSKNQGTLYVGDATVAEITFKSAMVDQES
mgnify:CR=1 FL=1